MLLQRERERERVRGGRKERRMKGKNTILSGKYPSESLV